MNLLRHLWRNLDRWATRALAPEFSARRWAWHHADNSPPAPPSHFPRVS